MIMSNSMINLKL